MTISRTARLAAVAVAGVLALAACGSDGGSSASSSGDANCVSGSLKASGSSAQKNAMAEWINGYQSNCSGATIDYQANGSGAGIQDFINKQTAFAGSDSALKEDDKTAADARCATGPAIDIPMVGGAIVAAYNVSGVDKLILSSDVLAGIFGNTITKWNDPKIAGINPGVTLPDATIAQFHRSDSSGTTDNFTKFIATTSTAWTFGNAKEWTAPGGQGAKGSDGVASAVKSTPNSIGYVELSFAQDAKLDLGMDRQRIRHGGRADLGERRARPSRRRRSRAPATTSPSRSTTRPPPATPPSWSPTRSPARRASRPAWST